MILYFDGDGVNLDHLVAWNDDENKQSITLHFVGGYTRILGLAGPQAQAFLTYMKTVGVDLRKFVPVPIPKVM